MPARNFTIDNTNPLISYQPPSLWQEGNSTQFPDAFTNEYFDSTFTLSITNGAYAQFSFTGTDVYIFGAKRGNHGPYGVSVDNGPPVVQNGASPNPGIFQAVLFSAHGLPEGPHNVTITNLEALTVGNPDVFLDIDFITWTSQLGEPAEAVTDTYVQDGDQSFVYSPATAWSTNIGDLTGFNGTGHITFETGASVKYNFQGDAVQLYGAVGPNFAQYSVSVDGGSPSTHNATKKAYSPQVLLYYADNLGPGSHELTLTNAAVGSGQGLSVDYAVISNVPSANTSTIFGMGISTLVGLLTGAGVLVLLILLLLTWWLCERRQEARRRSQKKGEKSISTSATPPAYTYTERPPERRSSFGNFLVRGQNPNATPSALENGTAVGFPTPVQLAKTSPYPRSQSPASQVSRMTATVPGLAQRAGSPGHQRGASSISYVSQANAPAPPLPPPLVARNPSVSASNSSQGGYTQFHLQSGANGYPQEKHRSEAPFASYAPPPNQPQRMVVPGRSQDLGPVPHMSILPPDYLQAIEPMPETVNGNRF